MASGENRKIRLVKCPKCMRLLHELPDVPVYECGGCGTILQAKIRRDDLENSRLALPKTESVHSPSVLEQVSEDTGSTSANQTVNFLQVENGSQLEDLNIPKQVSSSVNTASHDNENLPVVHENEDLPVVHDNDDLPVIHENEDLPVVLENGTNSSNLGNSSNDKLHDTSIRSPETTADEPGTEIVASTMRASPSHGIDRIRPRENLVTIDLIARSSEFGDSFEDMSTKSPTNRYTRANGGRVSSFDGTNDQVPVEMQRQLKYSLSSETRYYSLHNSPHGDEMRLNEDESPMVPFYGGSPSPSYHWHDESRCSSSFCSPDDNLQYEHERMKLLRMVYELQNQLEGTHMHGGHAHAYPNVSRHETRGEENWDHQSRFSQKPFLRESPNYRRQQANHLYLNPYKKGLYGAHDSSSSTPRRHIIPEVPVRYMDSPFSLQSRDSTFDDKKQKYQHLVKRHFRPMAGGAPFVTCYHCLKPLQLPADFLRFEKKSHWLRCGACTKILKFSLRNSSHILPYAPSSSEADKNMSSECVEERKMKMSLFKPSRNGYKNHPMNSESVGTSAKRFDKEKQSSAIEELGPKRGPALHRLMGYDSPSQVIRGFDERRSYTSDAE